MVVSDNEERDVKFVRQSSDGMVCIPPKKRHLHWILSPSTSQSPCSSLTEYCQPQQEQCIQQFKSSVSNAGAQEIVSEPLALATTYCDEAKEGLSGKKDSVVEGLPDNHNQGISDDKDLLLPALESNSSTDQTYSKVLDPKDKSLLPTREKELQPASKELDQASIVNRFVEHTSSDKHIACKIEDNELESFNGHDHKTVVIKQEKPDACFRDLGLPEGKMYMQRITGEANSVQLCSSRSNWDLNTMMDSWDGSTDGSSVNNGEGEKQILGLGHMNNNKNENRGNLVSFVPEHVSSDTHLKLQLNPSSGNQSHFNLDVPYHSSRLNSSGNLSGLGLSVKPIASGGMELTNVVKPEPYVDYGPGGKMHLEKVSKTVAIHKTVKPEPCDVVAEDGTSSLVPDGLKLASKFPVKPETEGDVFHLSKETMVKKEPCTGLHIGSLNGPQVMKECVSSSYTQPLLTDCSKGLLDLKQKMSSKDIIPHITDLLISNCLDSFSISQGSDGTELDKNLDEGKSPTTGEIALQTTSATQHSDSRTLCNSQDYSENVSTAIVENHIAGGKLPLISDIMDTTATKARKSEDCCESKVGLSKLHSKLVASDYMGQVGTDGAVDKSALMPSLDGSAMELAGPVSVDMDQVDLQENERVANSCKIDKSAEMLEGKPYTCMASNCFQNASNILQENPKPHVDNNNDDIEDGEFRDLQLQHCPIMGLCDGVEAKLTNRDEGGAHVDPVGFPLIAVPHVCGMETTEIHKEIDSRFSDIADNPGGENDNACSSVTEHIQNSSGKEVPTTEPSKRTRFSDIADNPGGENDNACSSVTEHIQNSSGKEVPTTEPSKRKLLKTVHKITNDNLFKERGVKYKLPSSKSSSLAHRTLVEDGIGDAGSCKVDVEGSKLLLADYSTPSIDDARHVESKANHSHIIHLNPASKGFLSGREKASERRPISSQIGRERSCDRSHRGDVSHQRRNRDESSDNGLQKFEKERKKDETSRKAEGEFVHARGRFGKQFESQRVDWNTNPDYASKRFNRRNRFQFSRSKNSSEVLSAVGMDCSVESAGRSDLEHLSSRRSPGERAGPMHAAIQMVRRPVRDISPGRLVDGTVPNLVLLNREQKFIQDLPQEMVEASVYSGSHSNFERGDAYIHRGRRSLSPIQRRGHPRLSQMCSPSSMRRTRSPRQWSPLRSAEAFDTCHEAIHLPAVRVKRMRSPHQRDCFPDEMAGRRPHSPLHQIRDDIRNVGPLGDYEYARNDRPYQGNINGIHVIGGHVNSEEYFEHLHSGQLHELAGDDGIGDGRDCSQRHGLMRSLGRRYNDVGSDVNEENFHFRIDRDPHRTVRYHPGTEEEFRERGDTREGGISGRQGDLPRRLRNEERGDNRQRVRMQGWHDSGFNEVRVKRRRY